MLAGGVRVLIYSGNNDLVCSYSSTRYWIYSQLNESDTGKSVTNWTSWHVEGEVGGWYQEWEQFAFMVVRDAGHEVPEYQPVRAYSLFQRFLDWNYNDTPIAVEHAEWMGVEWRSDDDDEATTKGIGFGILIGMGICVFLMFCGVAVLWLFRRWRIQQEHDGLSSSMIQ